MPGVSGRIKPNCWFLLAFYTRMYDEGLGVPADRNKAIDLYKKAYNLDEGMDMDLHSDLSAMRLRELGVM